MAEAKTKDAQKVEHKNIHSALLQAKRDMGPVYKNASNPAFRSKYADLAAIVESVEESLQDNDILLTQPLETVDEKLFITTQLFHAPTETQISSRVEVRGQDMNNPQKVGSSVTYFRRYSLLALLGIAPEDDDGNEASQKPTQHASTSVRPTPAVPRPTSTPTEKPEGAYSWTAPDGKVVELVPCEIDGCKKGVQLAYYEYNKKKHDGHTICRFHSENGDWKSQLKQSQKPAEAPEGVDPDMYEAAEAVFGENKTLQTMPDGSVVEVEE